MGGEGEDVPPGLHNTGGSAVCSGSVTFGPDVIGTHVIGALGVDWATLESAAALPAPTEVGARKMRTWTVCVDGRRRADRDARGDAGRVRPVGVVA
ncbi:hypothetical protein M2271_007612 [Streptomyces sp. LBL]|nr:hypothetical protein [Streptomyces sp. LBL]